jgi:hypothetical protein
MNWRIFFTSFCAQRSCHFFHDRAGVVGRQINSGLTGHSRHVRQRDGDSAPVNRPLFGPPTVTGNRSI